MFYIALYLIALTLAVPASGSETAEPNGAVSVLVLPNPDIPMLLGRYLAILEDPTGQLSFQDVSSSSHTDRFVASAEDVPNLGYMDGAVWVRLRVVNKGHSAGRWRLVVDDARISEVDFYLAAGSGKEALHQIAGRMHSFDSRPVKYRRYAFEFDLNPGEQRTVYLRFQSNASIHLSIKLWSAEALARFGQAEYWLLGLFYGTLLALAGYNLFLFLSLRESSYLYLVLTIVGILFNQAGRDGIAGQFLIPGSWSYSYGPVLSGLTGLAALQQFGVGFLKLQYYSTGLYRIISLLTVVTLSTMLMAPLLDYALFMLTVLVAVTLPVLLLSGTLVWRAGYRPAGYYLMAWGPFLVVIFIMVASHLQLIGSYDWVQSALYSGTVWMVMLFSLGQADRMNLLKRKAERANLALRENEAKLEHLVEQRTAELVAARDRAEQGSRAKSAFLANMSHELRTPMNAVLGFSSLLKDTRDPGKQRRYLDAIRNAGKSLLQLIDDILDLSKIEAGKVQLRPRSLDLRRLVEEVELLFSYRVAEKGLLLSHRIDADLPAALRVDEVRLRQVLVNLIGNAIKFTEQGHVELRLSGSWSEHRRYHLRIVVEDTGIGVPAEFQREIFDFFSQRPGQDVARYGGTGLGLAISRRLVGLMGGTLSLQSDPGQGSEFTLSLPGLEPGEPTLVAEPETPLPPGLKFAPAHILVVDDSQLNRDLLVDYLLPYGFKVDLAEDGMQALAAVEAAPPDLILMDIVMPVMDGLQAIRRLKADSATADIPVFAITASATREYTQPVKEICDRYLTKPISRDALIAALTEFLEHTSADPPAVDGAALPAAGGAPELPDLASITLPAAVREKLGLPEMQHASINEVQALARDLITAGEGGDKALLRLGEWLLSRAQAFDMRAVQSTLDELRAAEAQPTKAP